MCIRDSRCRYASNAYDELALVARLVPRKEILEKEAAMKSINVEWDKLVAAGCFDLKEAVEWSEVKKNLPKGKTVHIGSLIELCYQKGSELADDDPGKKYKGRIVFAGDRVKDQNGAAALFEELASSPAGMEASKFCDVYGLLPGHVLETADAEQAYIQANMVGTETWITIPEHRRPASWGGKKMVLPLRKALYGLSLIHI